MRILTITVFLVLFSARQLIAQYMEMPMNKVTLADLRMKNYPRDTVANAVILEELGQSHISSAEGEDLIFEHYQKIKILTKEGLDRANFAIVLHRNEKSSEVMLSVEAVTYNLNNGVKKEIRMDPKMIFTKDEKYSKTVTFALPDVHEGSVLEIKYRLNSPFLFNFRPWEFQTDIPKVHSEYWASIPGNYTYNISLRGFYPLSKNESSIIEDCYEPGGGNKANCALYKYAIDEVPAFVEEEFMTAKSNFISAVHFELSEVRYFSGKVDRVTKEWKDADLELKQHPKFGSQINKAENMLEKKVKELTTGKTDELQKAKIIYDLIKDTYTWNGNYGMFAEVGVKKLLETMQGNAGDINLAMVGALNAAGLQASPVILSTRSNGTPIELFPVLSEFDYVIGSVDIQGKRYLLDATNNLQPFGFLPLRCLNGKGRIMSKVSAWTELKPRDKKKTTIFIDLKLTPDGDLVGKVTINRQGYSAFYKRIEIATAGDIPTYAKNLGANTHDAELSGYDAENFREIDLPLIEKMDIRIPNAAGGNAKTIFYNPFSFDWTEIKPLRSSERLYPVDFGAPREEVLTVNLKYGTEFEVDELPGTAALSLPRNGGRFLLSVVKLTGQVTITSTLTLNRAVYSSEDYPFLKELFSRISQVSQSQVVLKKQ